MIGIAINWTVQSHRVCTYYDLYFYVSKRMDITSLIIATMQSRLDVGINLRDSSRALNWLPTQ